MCTTQRAPYLPQVPATALLPLPLLLALQRRVLRQLPQQLVHILLVPVPLPLPVHIPQPVPVPLPVALQEAQPEEAVRTRQAQGPGLHCPSRDLRLL